MTTTPDPHHRPIDDLVNDLRAHGHDDTAIRRAVEHVLNGGQPVAPNGRTMPTVAEYVERVQPLLANEATRATWRPHFRRLTKRHGADRLDALIAEDFHALIAAARAGAMQRRDSRGGTGAARNATAAYKWLCNRAVDSGYLHRNPAAKIRTPRPKTRRRAMDRAEAEELIIAAGSGGDDPLLDLCIVRFLYETGARRDGLLSLTLGDIQADQGLVRLREKGDKTRSVPATIELLDAIVDLAHARGSHRPDDPAFRYLPRQGQDLGAPLTRRRFNTLFPRLQRQIDWAGHLGVSAHWLRHTAGTLVRGASDVAVAAEYLGHTSSEDVTMTYVRGCAQEVIDAWTIAHRYPHPRASADVLDLIDPDSDAERHS